MRPKKKILLAGNDEDRVGVLRFLLETHGRAVIMAFSAAEAYQVMQGMTPDLLFIVRPLHDAQPLLRLAKVPGRPVTTLAASYDEDRLPADWVVDATIGRGEYSSAWILEKVKVLTARKRGPRKEGSVRSKAEG